MAYRNYKKYSKKKSYGRGRGGKRRGGKKVVRTTVIYYR